MEKDKAYKAHDPASDPLSVNEDSIDYILPEVNIKVYSSFEEMNYGDHRQAANIDPIEGLRNTIELILKVYGVTREELANRKYKDEITVIYHP